MPTFQSGNRTTRRATVLVFLSLVAAIGAFAQTSSKAVVTTTAAGPSAPAKPGQPFNVVITLAIRSGYHINAQKPSEDYLIGTSVAVQPPDGVTVVKTAYPSAKYAKFSFSDTPLAVYQGTAQITVTLKASASATGPITVPCKVTFQACNDEQCLPPSTVEVTASVELEATDADQAAQSITITGAPAGASVLVDGRPAGQVGAQGRFIARNVAPGRHKVRVEMEGFAPWEQQLVVADEPLVVAAALVPSNAAQPPVPTDVPSTPVTPAPQVAPVPAATPDSAPAGPSNTRTYVAVGAVAAILAALGVFAVTRTR
ncbi:MAG TPA: protein-disulfide reductase DsbD family protein [Blastocatellia bacterium]|nr:protein-disulfide reductase DsbD family protein [Blastocatellia bacterium]